MLFCSPSKFRQIFTICTQGQATANEDSVDGFFPTDAGICKTAAFYGKWLTFAAFIFRHGCKVRICNRGRNFLAG